jgi:Uma2 family endonuclease
MGDGGRQRCSYDHCGKCIRGIMGRLANAAWRVYISDMKLGIEAADAVYYPDVFVTRDARDRESEYYKQRPCLIVEVLSPSAEAFDHGAKFAAHRIWTACRSIFLSIRPEFV